MAEHDRETATTDHQIEADISREIVRIHAHYYGRGPTKSKTFVEDQAVLCLLGEIFTPAEEILVEGGRFEEVRSNRIAFQDAVEGMLREAVERITGRAVHSFLSQISEEGFASEVFVLGKDEAGTSV
ncbi:MAG: DUF2294 family protein [Actinobacteria bacterium]|nr:DUF2294 family protein [Actinomycetota bacterium]